MARGLPRGIGEGEVASRHELSTLPAGQPGWLELLPRVRAAAGGFVRLVRCRTASRSAVLQSLRHTDDHRRPAPRGARILHASPPGREDPYLSRTAGG